MPEQYPKPKGKLRRSLFISFIALKYFVFHSLTSLRKKSLGERLRMACQRLGITFIKVGQLLSGRYDLLEETDLLELKKLLDQADPMPEKLAHEIINRELGIKAKCFSDLILLSSASVAQVYATTYENKSVVVKVLRPEVRQLAETDLAILYRLVIIAQKLYPTLRRLKVAQAVMDMRQWIREETDLSIELSNMELFRSHLATNFPTEVRSGLGQIIIPITYPELSTPKILVMERFHGVTVSDWLRGVRPANEERYDPQTSVMTLFAGSLRPIFEGQGCPFHGDPHPANVVILENGNIGLIDFGLMGQYDETTIRAANKLYFAIYLKNAELATKALLQFTQVPMHHYDEVLPDMRVYVDRAEQSGFGEWLKGTVQILQKHKLAGPDVLKDQRPNQYISAIMVKFVLLVDSMAHDFFPDKSTADLLGPELEAGIVAQIVHNLKRSRPLTASLGLAYSLSEVVAEGPELVGKVFGRFL